MWDSNSQVHNILKGLINRTTSIHEPLQCKCFVTVSKFPILEKYTEKLAHSGFSVILQGGFLGGLLTSRKKEILVQKELFIAVTVYKLLYLYTDKSYDVSLINTKTHWHLIAVQEE